MTKKKLRKIRGLNKEGQMANLQKARKDLNEKKAQLSAGGSIDNPAKIKQLRKTISRYLTVLNEGSE